MYFLVHKSSVITLQSGGDVDSRIATIGHRDTFNGRAALKQTAIPVRYA